MQYNNLFGKISVILSYLGLFTVTTYFSNANILAEVLMFSVGLLLGLAILEADENYLYKYYAEKNNLHKKLVTRSLLFLITMFPLGVFLMTSTGSMIGVGLFLSIISGLALEFYLVRNNPVVFHQRFMYQLKRKVSQKEQRIFTTVFVVLSILYGVLVIFPR